MTARQKRWMQDGRRMQAPPGYRWVLSCCGERAHLAVLDCTKPFPIWTICRARTFCRKPKSLLVRPCGVCLKRCEDGHEG